MKPIRFGVLAETSNTPDQLLATARLAEDAGCSTLLIRDHLVEGPFPHQLAPLTALAFVAAATTRLRVGTLVICNEFRHPAVLAKEVATLDVLSGGRVELGLGAGFLRSEFDQAGLAFDAPAERVGRLEESIHVLKGLFAGGPFTYRGRHYQVDALHSHPASAQHPHPPLHIAAAQPRMLRIAGREADIVALQAVSTTGGVMTDDPNARTVDTVERQLDVVRQAAAERQAAPEISTTVTIRITERPRYAARELAGRRGWGVDPATVLAMPSVFMGPLPHITELMQRRCDELGLSYLVVSDRDLPTLAHVIPDLVGVRAG
jgi:probable F420-dependent oxidoreductase